MHRRMTPFLFSALAFLSLGGGGFLRGAEGAREEGGGLWEVEGRGYETHSLLRDLERRAEEALRESQGGICRTFGPRSRHLPVRWILDVSREAGPVTAESGARGRPPLTFFEDARMVFAKSGLEVRIPARKYLRRPGQICSVIAHEATHAALASALGSRERYFAVPGWFREGIALWYSGEGSLRLNERIAYTTFQGRPAASFLQGISTAGSDGAPVSHAESYLAVCWIESRLGRAGLEKLCSEVGHGGDLGSLLEALLGLAPDAVAARALRYAKEEVAVRLPPGLERRFRTSVSAGGPAGDEAAETAWERLLAEAPQCPLAGTLRYLLARELLRAGQGADRLKRATAHLEEVVAGPGTLWRPEALVLLGDCLRAAGREPEARLRWLEVIEAFGEDPVPAARARRKLGIGSSSSF